MESQKSRDRLKQVGGGVDGRPQDHFKLSERPGRRVIGELYKVKMRVGFGSELEGRRRGRSDSRYGEDAR